MYNPSHFQETRSEVLLELIKNHALASITRLTPEGLVADHIPLMHIADGSPFGKLIGHVAKKNPIWQSPSATEHLIIFQASDHYISPNWYASKAQTAKVVPTWNYAVVHITAHLKAIENSDGILAILENLTVKNEASQAHPWQVQDAPADYLATMMANIVGIEFEIKSMVGKFKVSQNQVPDNQKSVVTQLEYLAENNSPSNAQAMAAMVKKFGNHNG